MTHIVDTIMGKYPFDLVITNCNFVNLSTAEIYAASIGIVDGFVGHVTQPEETNSLHGKSYYDAKGKYAIPGLIDTHVHIESSMITPVNFARQVVPAGTTTILADPHELANVMGLDGIRYLLEASEGLPLDIFVAAPSCVPSVVSSGGNVETSHTQFDAPEIEQIMAMPRVIALGEVMDYIGVIQQNPRMAAIIQTAKKNNALIQGHIVNMDSTALSAYLAAGCVSDHETMGFDEAVRKLRSGLVLECRYASNCHDMPVLAKALAACSYPINATMCTDDREPDDLIQEGHIDNVVRKAIEAGMPPIEAIRLATRNAAAFLRLPDRGEIKAGKLANILLIENLETFFVDEVFISGRLCAQKGKMISEITEPKSERVKNNSVILKRPPQKEDFFIPAAGKTVKLNYILYNQDNSYLTKRGTADFPVIDGHALIKSQEGFVTMVVFERHGVNGNIGRAPIGGLGMTAGAIAGTVSHDCHNLFVIGTNVADMLDAVYILSETGGGFVCVIDAAIKAKLALPICGLLSEKPAVELQDDIAVLKQVLGDIGIRAHSPLNLLTAFSLSVLPEIRLTDHGLVDTITQQIIPLYAV
jgi:adenine deaminase